MTIIKIIKNSTRQQKKDCEIKIYACYLFIEFYFLWFINFLFFCYFYDQFSIYSQLR